MAYLIDLLLGGVGVGMGGALCLVVAFVVAESSLRGGDEQVGSTESFVVGLVVVAASLAVHVLGPALYEAAFLASPWGATPGKRLFGLRVVDARGEPPRFLPALVRGFTKLVVMWVFYPSGLLVVVDPQRRAPWDFLVGSRVVRAR